MTWFDTAPVYGWGRSEEVLRKALGAQILTAYYFAFFILMPFWSAMGQTKAVPERVPEHD